LFSSRRTHLRLAHFSNLRCPLNLNLRTKTRAQTHPDSIVVFPSTPSSKHGIFSLRELNQEYALLYISETTPPSTLISFFQPSVGLRCFLTRFFFHAQPPIARFSSPSISSFFPPLFGPPIIHVRNSSRMRFPRCITYSYYLVPSHTSWSLRIPASTLSLSSDWPLPPASLVPPPPPFPTNNQSPLIYVFLVIHFNWLVALPGL